MYIIILYTSYVGNRYWDEKVYGLSLRHIWEKLK